MAKPRKKTDYDRLHDYEYKIRHYTKQQKKKREKESEGKNDKK